MSNTPPYLFLSSEFPKRSETFVYDQLRLLKHYGLEFHIISNRKPKRPLPDMAELNGQVTYLDAVGKWPMLWALWLWKLRHPIGMLRLFARALRMEAPLKVSLAQMAGAAWILQQFGKQTQQVHAHFAYGAAGVAMWLRRMGSIPYSLTLHGSDLLLDAPDRPMKLEEASRLVCISHYNRDYVHTFYSAVKTPITVLPLGVYWPEELPEHSTYSFGYPLRLLNVGRMIEAKGQRYLIEACAILKAHDVPFHCTIAGEGPLQKDLRERIAAAGLQDYFTLPGSCTHRHILELYEEADVYVHPSVSEGIPVVLMEAMRAGLPVVATDITGIPELVEHEVSGLLVPPENPQALAETLLAIYAGRVTPKAYRDAARNTILTRFNLQNNTLAFKELLESIGSRG